MLENLFILAGQRRVDPAPQGTLGKRISEGGAGFGGVPTATGSERWPPRGGRWCGLWDGDFLVGAEG